MKTAGVHIEAVLKEKESQRALKLEDARPLVKPGIDLAKATDDAELMKDCAEAVKRSEVKIANRTTY